MVRFVTAIAISVFLLTGCEVPQPTAPQERYERAIQELDAANSEIERFYALNDAAKESFVAGNRTDAQQFAEELIALLPKYKRDWNYGNAVQDSNLVLGRIAVSDGRIDEARRYLLAAGRSPGSPQMDTFGPNMSLAKDLLEQGEIDVVLEYFELCRNFWEMDAGRLDSWTATVKDGGIPNFGPNLVY